MQLRNSQIRYKIMWLEMGIGKAGFDHILLEQGEGTIWIEKVNWLDKDNGEADIYLTDGIYNVVCFSSSFYGDEEQEFKGQIYSYEAENLYKKCEIRKKDDGIYHLEGKMVDRENKIVRIGEFVISLSNSQIDKDILLNDYIEFEISRLDIY